MLLKIIPVLALASLCTASANQADTDIEKQALAACQVLAREMNQSRDLGIRQDGMTSMFSWHAACAERPPRGPGNVTALCEGKRTAAKGGGKIFFWQKSDHGKLSNGYFNCPA